MGAVAVLCSSRSKLIKCGSRFARFVSVFAAIFAGITLVSLVVSFRAGMPQHVAAKVGSQCVEMPAETFAWAHHVVDEHQMMNASAVSVDFETWSQPETCDKVARVVACAAKMIIVGSALAHLCLLLSAVAVVKRACRLRCAAFRAGLLKWKCCKASSTCAAAAKRVEPTAAMPPPFA